MIKIGRLKFEEFCVYELGMASEVMFRFLGGKGINLISELQLGAVKAIVESGGKFSEEGLWPVMINGAYIFSSKC